MAKRSDFAQKLLDDLRLRKERMAATQRSSHSNSMAGDACGYSQQSFRGCEEIKTHGTIGSKLGKMHKNYNAGNRPLTIEEASKQIVPFGRGQNSEQIGDLSTALAFAFQNGGKLGKMESTGTSSVLHFLHHIGRRQADFGQSERRGTLVRHRSSTTQLPTLSPLYIKEISKGAQKLNQILRACTNGVNFDKYSVEIGKELLKGAIDLEESLRMLVNLQEASDYMISTKGKSHVRLIEVDGDDEENTEQIPDEKQLDRPRFSFDKPSRNSHGTSVIQRLTALIYPTEAPKFKEKQAPKASNSVSHKRSASCGPDFGTPGAYAEQKKHSSSSKSKSEKGRLPNVIARLMGLEGLPEKVDSKNKQESTYRQKMDRNAFKKATQGSTTKAELKTNDLDNLVPKIAKHQLIRASEIPETQDRALASHRGKNLVIENANFNMVLHPEKSPWRDLGNVEGMKPVIGSRKANLKMNKQQSSNINSMSQITGSRKGNQEHTVHTEQRATENGDIKDPFFKDEPPWVAPQKRKSLDDANILQEKSRYREIMPQTEKRNSNGLLPGNQKRPWNDPELQQQHVLQRNESQEEKSEAEEAKQQFTKQKLDIPKQRGSESIAKMSSKPILTTMNLPKQQPHVNQATYSRKSSTEAIDAMTSKGSLDGRNEDLAGDGGSTNLKISMKDSTNRSSEQNSSPSDQKPESEKVKPRAAQVVEEKPTRVPSTQKKVDNKKMYKREIPRKIDEVMTRKKGTPRNVTKPLKSHLQKTKQRRQDKIGGSNTAERETVRRSMKEITRSNESKESIQPMNIEIKLQKEGEQADESTSLSALHVPAPDISGQNITSTTSNDNQGQATAFGRDQELKINKIIPSPLPGSQEASTDIPYPSQLEQQKISKSWMQEPLTEDENHLKQVLTQSQVFLNSAEALFKLNIPVGILNAVGHIYQYEDGKLVLDCGYEVMKRKGRRLELSVHPCVKTTISFPTKIRSLDDLVKQLHKDIDNLRFCGRDGINECDTSDYLYKMLENDLHGKDPDVNCMWDLGWNEMALTFLEKDEVIRDVERHMLNGLLDEIAREFLY
ncbi:uncharacterized protein LOC131163008 [Malania oleifera]|uniref:uncharacterized protein LOC131163008 n=1 Tax=Malania oleifera TaxID=397392 RepID=UPI0025AE18A6|nr:uncharacterized protein LOC131163008 [Malania oleifera]